MPGENEFVHAPEYVAARAVLLDALDALDGHLPTIIVVGAQAVYLHTGAGDFVEPPMTTDGDLALNAESLKTSPEITAAMAAVGFKTRVQTLVDGWAAAKWQSTSWLRRFSPAALPKVHAQRGWSGTRSGLPDPQPVWNPPSSTTARVPCMR